MSTEHPGRVIEHLARQQANAVQLYLRYKGYHWNVGGPTFHDLHALFDEHATAVLETIDALAERQLMQGAAAGYSLEFVRRHSSLGEEREFPSSPREMIESLLEAHRNVVDGMRSAVHAAEQAGDVGTVDLLVGFIRSHEKMEWFLRKTLEGRSTVLSDTHVEVWLGGTQESGAPSPGAARS